jgi:pimeloyl-ACP methyl ester carboxylesterase
MASASTNTSRLRAFAEAARAAYQRRAGLNWYDPPAGTPRPRLRLMLGEVAHLGEPLRRRLRPPLVVPPAAHKRYVMLLPGFAANEEKMRPMAEALERAGHKAKRWGLGWNLGPSEENLAALARRLVEIHARYGEKIYLVGWSLGGLFARELAKLHPECVAKVVTMGSPFSQSPYANNVWRAYQMVTGHSVAAPPVASVLSEKPPVETVALWSPRDGAIAPRSACGLPGERDRARALRCTHMGFCYSPEAIMAVLEELQ